MKRFTLRHWLISLATLLLALPLVACSDDDDDDLDEFSVQLVGENEVPPIASIGDGEMDITYDEDSRDLTIDGSFDNLVADALNIGDSPAHLHLATADATGPVIYDLTVDLDEDRRGGTFEFERTLSTDEAQAFEDLEWYVNIHSQAYPDGELRGQLDPDAPTYEDVDEGWGVLFDTAALPELVDTTAGGWAWIVIRDDNSAVISGSIEDLSSEPTEVFGSAVNLETGELGETGELVANLNYEVADDGHLRFWYQTTFEDDEIDAMRDGDYFLTVYTQDFDQGELRAQIPEDDDTFFEDIWESFFGEDDDPIEQAPPF